LAELKVFFVFLMPKTKSKRCLR